MEFLNLSSVELLPNAKASAAFTVDISKGQGGQKVG